MELSIQNLSKKYGEKTALNALSYTLTEGVYGLLGPNGAGKSTLMNILTGNLKATGGRILYDGSDTALLGRDFLARIGYMPQQQALYPQFTAARFLAYMAALKGISRTEARARIPEVLRLVELEDKATSRIATFSGGMKQRLLIAQAVLGDPDILILDEPTAGLDPKQRIAVRNLIASLAQHKIVLIATHVVSDVEFISREVLLLRQGRLLRQDSRLHLIRELEGKVFELEAPEESLPSLQRKYKVGGLAQGENGLYVRVLSEQTPEDYPCQLVRPTLEDVYLWYCDE